MRIHPAAVWVTVLASAQLGGGAGAFVVPSSSSYHRVCNSHHHPSSLVRGGTDSLQRMSMVDETSVSSSDVSVPYDAAARLAYDEWRAKYGKGDFDPVRYPAFRANYETITVANVSAKKKARDEGTEPPSLMSLNEFGDCTEDEYAAATASSASAPSSSSSSSSKTSTGSVLGKALEAAASQSEASSALEDAANALAEEEEKLAKQLGLKSVEELEVALDSLEGIADDGGELEGENLSREARVRSAYLDWCKQYDKKPDEERFPVFSSNYLAMEEYAKSSGKEVTLNAYADRTEEEYEKLQSRKGSGGKVGSATVVDEVAAAAAEAAAEAERVKARAEARARAEAERRLREEAAAKEREAAAAQAEKRAAEERKRQKELQAKLLALKEWQSKSEAERRALTEKEKAERQKAQERELERLREAKEAEAIRLAREAAEREAAQVAKRRAQDEEASRIARQQAREWEDKQRRLAESKAPAKTAPKRTSVFGAFAPPKKQVGTTKKSEAPRFEFELDISKIVPQKPQEEKKSGLDLSALNNLLPNPVPSQKKAAPKSPAFSFFSAPAPKTKAAPKPAPVVILPKPATAAKATPKESSVFSFFSSPAPAPKAKAAPVPVPAPSKPAPKPAPAFSFFASEKKAAPKASPVPVPSPAKASPKSAPALSFFNAPAPKAKATPAPVPVAPAVSKKPPAAPAFSFFSAPAPKAKVAPAPAPAPATKPAPAFSLFSSPAPKPAARPAPAPAPAPRPSFSLFPKAEIKEKPKVAPTIPNRGGTISLFGGPPAPKPAASAQPKVTKSSGTISLFGGASKPAASKPQAVPTNIPILKNWRQNPNGSITGLVSNSKNFKTGTEITTSPVPKGAKKGSVVTTGSGSQYLLQ